MKLSTAFLAVAGLLAATAALAKLADRQTEDSLARPLNAIPASLGTWRAEPDQTLDDNVLRVLKPTSYLSRIYKQPATGSPVSLFVAYYAQQRAGESMHSPKNCLPGAGWEIWNYDTTEIDTPMGVQRVNFYSIQKDNHDRMKVLYWYQTKKRIFSDEYAGRVFLLKDSVLEGVSSGTLVRVIVPDNGGDYREIKQFASLAATEIASCLRGH